MTYRGFVQNGVIVPTDALPLPEGSEVVIAACVHSETTGEVMSADELARYLAAFAQIDELPNERPGDNFDGCDHDSLIYG